MAAYTVQPTVYNPGIDGEAGRIGDFYAPQWLANAAGGIQNVSSNQYLLGGNTGWRVGNDLYAANQWMGEPGAYGSSSTSPAYADNFIRYRLTPEQIAQFNQGNAAAINGAAYDVLDQNGNLVRSGNWEGIRNNSSTDMWDALVTAAVGGVFGGAATGALSSGTAGGAAASGAGGIGEGLASLGTTGTGGIGASGAIGSAAAGVGGFGGAGGAGTAGAAGSSSLGSVIQNLLGGSGMSWTDWISPALQLIGGAYSSSQAGDAADAPVQAANNGIAENRRQFDLVRELLAPYVGAGNTSLSSYQNLVGANGPDAQQAAITALQGTPQYSALRKAGEDAILQNASATGGLRGGNVQDALATNRERLLAGLMDQQLGRYGSIINIGQNSAAGTGSAAMATGNNNAALMQQAGAAQAGGIVAGSNAITNAVGGVGGFLSARGWTPYTSTPASTGYGGAGVSGGGGFGTGVVYGNQDYGAYF